MIQLQVIELGSPTAEQLAGFKAFFAGAGGETDEQLTGMLRSAMAEVQEWEDRSLLAETLAVIQAQRTDPRAPIRLYRSVTSVTSVTDENDAAVPYTRFGNMLYLGEPRRNVRVEYVTGPREADLYELLPKAYRLAAAKYDGDDPKEINRIIMEG